MPISHYPRVGERLAPQALSDILDVRVCDSVRVGQLPARIRFNQLNESIWERTTPHHCEELAQALIGIVRLSLPQMLEQCGDRKLPILPVGTTLDDLSISIRTHNCLDKAYTNNLRGLRKATFDDVLGLYAFGMRSLVDLLVAIETLAAASASVSPFDVAFAGDDERDAAKFYVAQLIHRHPTAQRKLQASLDYQLSQYSGFYHKGIWASQARASFNAKVKNESGFPATLPSWPSSQIALDFVQKSEPETIQRELFETETQAEEFTEPNDNRVLDHVAQVADSLNAVDEQNDNFRVSSHRLAALMHSAFEPEAAREEFAQMRSSIQSLTEIVATWEEFASSLQKGERLSQQPNAEVLALVANIISIESASHIRCDDPRFGAFVIRLEPQSQTLGEALESAERQACQPHFVFDLQSCLRELQGALKSCCALTVEEELQSLVKAFLETSSTRLGTPRQDELCARRYGWDGRGGATLQEIALQIGVSRERVRQICRPAEQALDFLAELKPFAPALRRSLDFAAERAPITWPADLSLIMWRRYR